MHTFQYVPYTVCILHTGRGGRHDRQCSDLFAFERHLQ